MAITVVNIPSPSGLIEYETTDLDENKEGITSASTTIYAIDIDNSANGAATYLKFWNVASGSVTVGTTAPDAIILVPASTRLSLPFPKGWVFGTALTVAGVTTGGDGGTTGPTSAVTLNVVYA